MLVSPAGERRLAEASSAFFLPQNMDMPVFASPPSRPASSLSPLSRPSSRLREENNNRWSSPVPREKELEMEKEKEQSEKSLFPDYVSQMFYSKMFRGTIHPSATFDENQAAEMLEKAMRGSGCDKQKIIRILANVNNSQRQMIRTPYKVRYGKDLEGELKKELKGDLEDVIIALVHTPYQEDAVQLQKAVKGLGTNEKLLIELLTSRTNEQIEGMRNTYYGLFDRTAEKAIEGDTSGDFRKLLVALLQGKRDEHAVEDGYLAAQQAAAFAAPHDKKKDGDKIDKYMLLTSASFAQLRRVFDEYQKIAAQPFEKLIEKEFSGDTRETLLALVANARDRVSYFANLVHLAVKGGASTKVSFASTAPAPEKPARKHAEKPVVQVTRRILRVVASDGEVKTYLIAAKPEKEEEKKKEKKKKSKKGEKRVEEEKEKENAPLIQKQEEEIHTHGKTKDADLIRVLVARSEIDLADVKAAYETAHKKSIADVIKEECKGDYRDALLTILHGNKA